MDQATKRCKGSEVHLVAVGFEARAEEFRNSPPEKGVKITGKKVYRPPLPSTYKET